MKSKKDFRIVFMGTPEFARRSLQKIIDEKFNVVCVVTAPDKPAGRGRKISESAVKKIASGKKIPVLQPLKLKNPEFLKKLKGFRPDLIVVVAFRILPEEIWSLPPEGTINLHASLLPDYRGAAPINHAIMNGEKLTGITTFFIEKDIDTGEVILREEVPIPFTMNAGELHDVLMVKGADLLAKSIHLIFAGNAPRNRQTKKDQIKTAHKIYPEDCRINWDKKPVSIYNHIRGLSPYPGAWTTLQTINSTEINLKILESEIIEESHKYSIPSVISDKKNYIRISISGGYIAIKELQLPGKKRMKIKDFLSGNKPDGWKIV